LPVGRFEGGVKMECPKCSGELKVVSSNYYGSVYQCVKCKEKFDGKELKK
jgi:ribosomal protein L37AE/L43A